VARNGRVLLASPLALDDLIGQEARLRFQLWRRAILPGDRPEPYGILVCVDLSRVATAGPLHDSHLLTHSDGPFELALELGGGILWAFRISGANEVRSATSR
jgi:hypothetical protein